MIGDRSVETKAAIIIIKDISPQGLRLQTKLDLPTDLDIMLEFTFRLFSEEIKVLGAIVRKIQKTDTLYEYGIKLNVDHREEQTLMKHVNMLNSKIGHQMMVLGGNFVSEDELDNFYADDES